MVHLVMIVIRLLKLYTYMLYLNSMKNKIGTVMLYEKRFQMKIVLH